MADSPAFVERRLYRQAAAILAFQAAQGTAASDFTAATARAIWLRELAFSPGAIKQDSQGTTGTTRKRGEARFLREIKPTIRMTGAATPKNIEWLLRSWGGAWSGSPLSLGLTENINEFATVGIIEKAPPPNAQKFLRVWDSWAWRVALRMTSGLSALELEADLACRDYDRTPLSALGGITLPATAAGYMPPAIDVFAPHSFRLFRDPAGANVSIAVREIEITLEHGLNHETWNDRAPQVVKDGNTSIKVRLRGVWQDETYAIETDSETVTTTFRRFKAVWASGTKSFTIDMKNVDFVPSATGWRDGRFAEFIVEGEAYLGSDGSYVTFELVP